MITMPQKSEQIQVPISFFKTDSCSLLPWLLWAESAIHSIVLAVFTGPLSTILWPTITHRSRESRGIARVHRPFVRNIDIPLIHTLSFGPRSTIILKKHTSLILCDYCCAFNAVDWGVQHWVRSWWDLDFFMLPLVL